MFLDYQMNYAFQLATTIGPEAAVQLRHPEEERKVN